MYVGRALCRSYTPPSFPHTRASRAGTRLPRDGSLSVYRASAVFLVAFLCPHPLTHDHSAFFTASCFHPQGLS